MASWSLEKYNAKEKDGQQNGKKQLWQYKHNP